jgi:glyoxylate reductase
MSSILVTRRLPSSTIARLESGGEVEIHDSNEALKPTELRERVRGKTAVVTMLTDDVDKAFLDAGDRLKIVANVAVGFNNIDLPYARQRGIVVTNTPDVLTDSVAEFTWALILAAVRRLGEGERILRRGDWAGWAFDFLLGTGLRGKQLGLVGFGRIAQAVAAKAPTFGMKVVYSTRQPVDHPGAQQVSLDQLLNTSDVVSLHVPLNTETRHLIDRRALARMKRSAYLINTSRGPVVDEEALAWALKERLIAGAALDVYEREPAVYPDLLTLENAVLIPHLGSGTIETRTAMADLAVDNVLAVLAGKPALTPV